MRNDSVHLLLIVCGLLFNSTSGAAKDIAVQEKWCESSLARVDSRHRLLGALTRIRDDVPVEFVEGARPRALFEFFGPEVLDRKAAPIFLRTRIASELIELEIFRPGRRKIDDEFLALVVAVDGHTNLWRRLDHPRDFGPADAPSQTKQVGFKSPGQKPSVNFRYLEINEEPYGIRVIIGVDVPCREEGHFSVFETDRKILANHQLSCRVPVLKAWYPFKF